MVVSLICWINSQQAVIKHFTLLVLRLKPARVDRDVPDTCCNALSTLIQQNNKSTGFLHSKQYVSQRFPPQLIWPGSQGIVSNFSNSKLFRVFQTSQESWSILILDKIEELKFVLSQPYHPNPRLGFSLNVSCKFKLTGYDYCNYFCQSIFETELPLLGNPEAQERFDPHISMLMCTKHLKTQTRHSTTQVMTFEKLSTDSGLPQ